MSYLCTLIRNGFLVFDSIQYLFRWDYHSVLLHKIEISVAFIATKHFNLKARRYRVSVGSITTELKKGDNQYAVETKFVSRIKIYITDYRRMRCVIYLSLYLTICVVNASMDMRLSKAAGYNRLTSSSGVISTFSVTKQLKCAQVCEKYKHYHNRNGQAIHL